MSVRAYMLLDIVDRSCEYAVNQLRNRAEVILADRLEGYPNIIAIVEAANRQSLVEAVMPVLGCINGIAQDLRLLVTRDDQIPPDFLTTTSPTPYKRKESKRRDSKQGINAATNSEER